MSDETLEAKADRFAGSFEDHFVSQSIERDETPAIEVAEVLRALVKKSNDGWNVAFAYTDKLHHYGLELTALRTRLAAVEAAPHDKILTEWSDAVTAIIRDGVPRYLQNGGCSNCGGIPHTTTCMVGQLAALTPAPTTEPTAHDHAMTSEEILHRLAIIEAHIERGREDVADGASSRQLLDALNALDALRDDVRDAMIPDAHMRQTEQR